MKGGTIPLEYTAVFLNSGLQALRGGAPPQDVIAEELFSAADLCRHSQNACLHKREQQLQVSAALIFCDEIQRTGTQVQSFTL